MTTVAIMQPYFVPYAGYFRLFAAADLFVVYDCVQFPRRGYVHRNRLPDRERRSTWLTLPLEKAPRDAAIGALELRADATASFEAQLRRFPSLDGPRETVRALLGGALEPRTKLVPMLCRSFAAICEALGLPCAMVRSSTLGIPAALRGQDRILAIAEAVGARRYVNAPGGRHLYDRASFSARGIELAFLPPYVDEGCWSILHRVVADGPSRVASEIRSQVRFDD